VGDTSQSWSHIVQKILIFDIDRVGWSLACQRASHLAPAKLAKPGHSWQPDQQTEALGIEIMRLEGKVAIVSGAASGMGAATARRFAKEGAKVVIADMLMDEDHQVAADITRANGTA
jgi:short chain dehydrogenase